jgi:hypothetical protein
MGSGEPERRLRPSSMARSGLPIRASRSRWTHERSGSSFRDESERAELADEGGGVDGVPLSGRHLERDETGPVRRAEQIVDGNEHHHVAVGTIGGRVEREAPVLDDSVKRLHGRALTPRTIAEQGG